MPSVESWDTDLPRWARMGWAARPHEGPERERIAAAQTTRLKGYAWRSLADPVRLSRGALEDAMRLYASSVGFVLSISHDHAATIVGGVQATIRDEQASLDAAGFTHLHLCPARPLPHLALSGTLDDFEVIVTLNGRRMGTMSLGDVMQAVRHDAAHGSGQRRVAIIHHLLGWDPELLAVMVEAGHFTERHFWHHDLFALCPSVHLLRNDTVFCGAPPASSPMCELCVYGEERRLHAARVDAFLGKLKPRQFTPSSTLANMLTYAGVRSVGDITVRPLASAVFDKGEAKPHRLGRPIKIGFLGLPLYHKGWHVFESLANWYDGDPRYQFYALADGGSFPPWVQTRHAAVTSQRRFAMIDAVEQAGLHAVINWSLAYESFSFTALEAACGGAFVICRKDAGNVWPMIQSIHPKRGIGLVDETDLQGLFAANELHELVAASDRRLGRMVVHSSISEILG